MEIEGSRQSSAMKSYVIVWDVFMFLRGRHTFKENDLKAYLPEYGAKALNKNTINFLIFTQCYEGNRWRAKL